MRPVFNDSTHEQQFDKDGYITIDLLTQEEVIELKYILEVLKEESLKGKVNIDSPYKLSFFNDNVRYKHLVFDTLSSYFQEKVDVFLKGYKPLIINIFDKEPGTGEVPIHQNWTFVEESKYTSVSVWMPLVDVSRNNGALEFVRGSHRVLTPYRSPSIPWVFQDLFTPLKEKYLQPLQIRAGQAGILDDSIIHWSSENNSDQVRTAVQLIMVPEEAMPIHYYRTEEKPDQIEVFEVDSEFFMNFEMGKRPKAKSNGFIDFTPFKYNEAELVEKIATTNNPAIRELA